MWLFKKYSERKLREAFQALSRSEQDIFLMAQLKAMNGGEMTSSRRLKKKTLTNKRTFTTEIAILLFVRKHILICWELVENVRNHLATNGIIPRVHGNIERMPR